MLGLRRMASTDEPKLFPMVRRGYAVAEVTAFLDTIAGEPHHITPDEVRQTTFSTERPGYDKAQVIAHLSGIATAMAPAMAPATLTTLPVRRAETRTRCEIPADPLQVSPIESGVAPSAEVISVDDAVAERKVERSLLIAEATELLVAGRRLMASVRELDHNVEERLAHTQDLLDHARRALDAESS